MFHLNDTVNQIKINYMKSLSLKSIAFALSGACAMSIVFVSSCTKENQMLDLPVAVTQRADLVSIKTATAPVIDGVIDDLWANATKLNTITQVPDGGNGMFYGYIGNQYPLTLRSMYDETSIYFLAEYPDINKSVSVSPWYYDPATKRWAQEPSARTYDVNGNLTREGWGEDKFSMLWNIDNSVIKFPSQTCYASCHMFTPYLDPTTTPATMKPNTSGNHYTNGANEKIDMWWLKIGRDPLHAQFSDEYQDWAGGPSITNLVGGSGNGRRQDDQTVTGKSTTYPFGPTYSSNVGGTSNNTQSLALTAKTPVTKVNVPKYIIPTQSDYYYILTSDTGGLAKRVIAVDTNGVLTLSDNSTIDPRIGSDYQRIGDPVYGGVGPKAIPSYWSAPLTNGRADITCKVTYTGTSWIIEWKRLLKTPGTLKQDIDFTNGMVEGQMQDQPFGVAIFNKSNYQHGIKPNLLLKFQK